MVIQGSFYDFLFSLFTVVGLLPMNNRLLQTCYTNMHYVLTIFVHISPQCCDRVPDLRYNFLTIFTAFIPE